MASAAAMGPAGGLLEQVIGWERSVWLDVCHFVSTAYDFRLNGAMIGTRAAVPLYVAYWLSACGGSLMAGLLMGQPPGMCIASPAQLLCCCLLALFSEPLS